MQGFHAINNNIRVSCPYCGNNFNVEAPQFEKESIQLVSPHEVECVAYTRDIGRFDPKDEASWLSSIGWSRIGKDYFSLLAFEKIGILRINDPSINIRYRVQGCP